MLGKRKKNPEDKSHGKPHNTTLVFLGTVLIWFGWFGFNGGSALNASIRSMLAAFNTNTAASTGAIGWVRSPGPLFFHSLWTKPLIDAY